jgi:hypothetical protein
MCSDGRNNTEMWKTQARLQDCEHEVVAHLPAWRLKFAARGRLRWASEKPYLRGLAPWQQSLSKLVALLPLFSSHHNETHSQSPNGGFTLFVPRHHDLLCDANTAMRRLVCSLRFRAYGSKKDTSTPQGTHEQSEHRNADPGTPHLNDTQPI